MDFTQRFNFLLIFAIFFFQFRLKFSTKCLSILLWFMRNHSFLKPILNITAFGGDFLAIIKIFIEEKKRGVSNRLKDVEFFKKKKFNLGKFGENMNFCLKKIAKKMKQTPRSCQFHPPPLLSFNAWKKVPN